jgi:membrane-associated phospholipid phosphatase
MSFVGGQDVRRGATPKCPALKVSEEVMGRSFLVEPLIASVTRLMYVATVPSQVRRRPADKRLAAVAGLLYLGLGPLASRDPHRWERGLFSAVNSGGGSMPALRIPQQLGTPWLLPAMAVIGWLTKRPRLMVSAGVALPLEKGAEVVVKKVVNRRRPAQVMDPNLHDDAPTEGPSYPSGHAAIATCGVVLAAPYLSVPLTVALTGATALTAYTRVHQGAHFPLDAFGGILLGLSTGSFLHYAIGLPPIPNPGNDADAAQTIWPRI